jgi:hypothetical protein
MHMHAKHVIQLLELSNSILYDSDSDSDLDSSSSSSLSSSSSSDSDSDVSMSLEDTTLLGMITDLSADLAMLEKIRTTRYLHLCHSVIKCGQFELLMDYAQSPADHQRFVNMVWVSPFVFRAILDMIENDPIFMNGSNILQDPVERQLAVTLYRMGRYGNGASYEDLSRIFGIGEGTINLFTDRCFTAIKRLHPLFVRALTEEEKEVEKEWMDKHLGFQGMWRDGYLMYDGTIVVIYAKPGQNGHSYYTRKANYGLNAQVCVARLDG